MHASYDFGAEKNEENMMRILRGSKHHKQRFTHMKVFDKDFHLFEVRNFDFAPLSPREKKLTSLKAKKPRSYEAMLGKTS